MNDCGCQDALRNGEQLKVIKENSAMIWPFIRKIMFLGMCEVKAMGSSAHGQQMTTVSSVLPDDIDL